MASARSTSPYGISSAKPKANRFTTFSAASKTKERVPCYAATARPDIAQQLGFHGAKFPLPYGPEHGSAGMRKNVEFVKMWREKCGPDFPLMLDCYMALNVQ